MDQGEQTWSETAQPAGPRIWRTSEVAASDAFDYDREANRLGDSAGRDVDLDAGELQSQLDQGDEALDARGQDLLERVVLDGEVLRGGGGPGGPGGGCPSLLHGLGLARDPRRRSRSGRRRG